MPLLYQGEQSNVDNDVQATAVTSDTGRMDIAGVSGRLGCPVRVAASLCPEKEDG